MQKYPNSGRLNYAKNKVNPNSADLWGDITIERALLKQLLEESDTDDIVIKLSGWQKDGNYGPWFSIKVNTWKPEQQQVPQPKPAAPVNEEDLPF
jgi:hypothetical protein